MLIFRSYLIQMIHLSIVQFFQIKVMLLNPFKFNELQTTNQINKLINIKKNFVVDNQYKPYTK